MHKKKNIFELFSFLTVAAALIALLSLQGCRNAVDVEKTESNPTEAAASVKTESVSSDDSDTDGSTNGDAVDGKTTLTTAKTSASVTKKTETTVQNKNDANYIKNPDYESKYYIVVYTGSQSTVVYGKDSDGEYNKTIKVFTCSTGAGSSPTKTGMYRIFAQYRWRALVGGVYGQYCSSIGGNYLFHSVPYTARNESSLDSAEYIKLGSPASHGCIRMCVRDCKWIFDNAPIGTQVNIVNAKGPAGAAVPRLNMASGYNCWDPSDKWAENNPYFKTAATTETTSAAAASTDSNQENVTTTEVTEPDA